MKYFSLFALLVIPLIINSQAAKDLKKSVPVWFESNDDVQVLKWINDPLATKYDVQKVKYQPFLSAETIGTVSGQVDSFVIENFSEGEVFEYRIQKYQGQNFAEGFGFINFGNKVPAVHHRGKCLILIDALLSLQLSTEIERLVDDMEMDGWIVETQVVTRDLIPLEIKANIKNWYDPSYNNSHALLLLGRIAVPYSGNSAIDGHSDHNGAWASDSYYSDMSGTWTDNTVNNTSASRSENKNIPNDGKYDQTIIPGDCVIEIGRVDFYNLPAFSDDEVALTKAYLDKNHLFRIGEKQLMRRGIIENNFGNFDEGFGQNGWRNFVPMFGGENVKSGNYDVELETDDYLFSYACGGGSYTSCSGIGNTSNLWASKELKSIFTMNFGSYFGDWDSQNNFLRSALASGDILANMWAGRPNWYIHSMALGKHLGFCVPLTQNAGGFYSTGFGANQTHIALMGDPTLRMHAMKPPTNLNITEESGSFVLNWDESIDGTEGYVILRRSENEDWEILEDLWAENNFQDLCVRSNIQYDYMVKAVRLEQTGSGSYYNTSQGIKTSAITTLSNLPSSNFTIISDFEKVTFANNSTGATNYKWDFDDGNTSNVEEPVHIFLNEGNYNVCLTVSNNLCAPSTYCDSVTIISSFPNQLEVNIISPSCFGSNDGSIIVTHNSMSSALLPKWKTGEMGYELHDLVAGNYQFILINENTGDSLTEDITLIEPEQIKVVFDISHSFGSDGNATATLSGGVAPYELTWGDGSLDPNMLPPGEYLLTVTDSNGCIEVFTFKVEMLSAIKDLSSSIQALYPNPTHNQVNIRVSNNREVENIEIINTLGHSIKMNAKKLEHNLYNMDISSVPTGTYILALIYKQGQSEFIKIIKN